MKTGIVQRTVSGRAHAFGATGHADLNAAISAASPGSVVQLEPRAYFVSSPVVVPVGKSGVTIRGVAGKTEIVPLSSSNYLVRVGWTTGSPLAIDSASAPTKRTWLDNCAVKVAAANASRGQSTVVLSADPSTPPSAGELWLLADLQQCVDRTISAPYTNAVGRCTWLFKVQSYNAGTRTIAVDPSSGPCPQDFASPVCFRLTGEATYGACSDIAIEGIRFRGGYRGGKISYHLAAQCVFGLTVRDCEFVEWNDYPLDLFACSNVLLENVSFQRGSTSSTGRAIGLHGCSNATVASPTADANHRHLVLVTEGSANVLVQNGVVPPQAVMTDASWDTHGNKAYNVRFVNCRGGNVHVGNDSYVLGDDAVSVESCDVGVIRVQGGCSSVTIKDTNVVHGIEVSSKKTPDNVWYRGGSLTIQRCTVGAMYDAGASLRFVNSPGQSTILLEDSTFTDPTESGTYGVIDSTDHVCQTSLSFTMRRCRVRAPGRKDGKSAVRFWGAGTSVGTLAYTAQDNLIVCAGAKPFEFRSTGATTSTVSMTGNEVWGTAAAQTVAGMSQQWCTVGSSTVSGNVLRGL